MVAVSGWQCGKNWFVDGEKFICTRPENHAPDYHYDQRLERRVPTTFRERAEMSKDASVVDTKCGHQWQIPGDNTVYECSLNPEHYDPTKKVNEHYDERFNVRQRIIDPEELFPERKPEKETILTEAERIVSPGGERATTYGGPSASFNRIAELWSAYLGGNVVLTGRDVANLMILMKVSRTADTYHRDSYVDIAGYSRCVEMLEDEGGQTE